MSDEHVIFGGRLQLTTGGYSVISDGYLDFNVPDSSASLDNPFLYVQTGEYAPSVVMYDLYSGSGHNIFVSYPDDPGDTMLSSGVSLIGDYFIFRNGEILISGIDFTINSSNKFVLSPNPAYNNDADYLIKFSPSFNYMSGDITNSGFISIGTQSFNNGTAHVYGNQRRLVAGADYLENSTNDLLYGKFMSTSENHIL
jgi:hypothetical protein